VKAATGEEAEEFNESRLRDKLLHARSLKAARELGLERRVAPLRSFASFGGMQNFAKELVRSMSLSAQSHLERCATFSGELQPFCERFSINFDSAILQYVEELCSSTIASEKSIQEAASGELMTVSKDVGKSYSV
jgi:hypothetical protein